MITLKEFKSYCLAKSGTEESYPFKGETVWMKVSGKLFALTNIREFKMNNSVVPPFYFINLKCNPGRSLVLRQSYSAIIPAWHQSKKHWNTLILDGSISNDLIFDLIDHSYNIAVGTLSKKEISTLKQK